MTLKPGFHVIVSGIRIIVPFCGHAIAGNSGSSYVVRFPGNRFCRNSARNNTRRDVLMKRSALWCTFASPLSFIYICFHLKLTIARRVLQKAARGSIVRKISFTKVN